jgi:preprotein translocase subunit SecD
VAFWMDQLTGAENVEIDLNPAASQRLATWSTGHVGDSLAISLDGTIVAVPVVEAPITDGKIVVVFAPDRLETAKRLEAALTAGPLPYPLELLAPVAVPTD